MKKIFLSVLFYVAFFGVAFADYQIISVPISPNGDVPVITVSCTIGRAYTEGLYNNSLSYILGNYGLSGGISRKYCETGTISFDGFNMNTVLDSYNGVDNWNSWIHPPFKYVIVDSTNEGGCHSSSECAQYNLTGAWEGYSNDIYRPSNNACVDGSYGTTANGCTLAAGPIWTTVPYTRLWSDPRDDIPVPPPVGDPKNLPAEISPNGDVPAVSINCIPGHSYTMSLVHEVSDIVDHSLGVVQSLYCYPNIHNNVIAFSAFNLPALLTKRIDPSWWNYVSTPLEYVIKDTTSLSRCDDESCGLTNLDGAFNNYDHSVFLASSTYWTTVGMGPIFDTKDNGLTWFNPNVPQSPPTPTCVTDCFSNVLFLPGLESSRLYTTQTDGSEYQLWVPVGNSDVEKLYLNPDGSPINSNIYTRDIINTAFVVSKVYQSFSDTMDKLVTDGKIIEWKAFPYDWRMSVDDVISKPVNIGNGQTIDLVSSLKVLIKSSKSGKVTIVAHSNGGLVAKALLAKLQDMKNANPSDDMIDHIDMLILVASPQIGTAEAVPAILHGFDQEILGGWLLDNLHARELGRNMPSAYGLLPSKEYINEVSASPVAFSDNIMPSGVTTPFVKAYGNVIDSYSEYKSFLFGSEGRAEPAVDDNISPINLSPTLFNSAETLHDKIDAWTPPEGLRVVEVAGWGLDTVASFQYYPKYECTTPDTGTGKCGYVLDEKPIFTSDGDKTVVEPSALYMDGEKVWVNLKNYNTPFRVGRQHKDILEVPQLENLFSSLIENQTPTYDSVLTTTKPVDDTNRLRISIHSPVTLDAYDASGKHTGKVCSDTSDFCYAQEDIPNSSYLEFGEGKYLNLPQDSLHNIALQGTDIGTFTFDMQTVTPSGQTSTASFVDIPVTTQTQAEITLNQGVPQLALDVTGDGKTDFTLTPSATFDPITYLQIMKITIDSLDLTQAKIKAFDTRVDNIIKSIQKGKIDKAKLKADKFETVLKNRLAKPDPKKPKLKKLSKTDAQLLLDMLNQLLDNLS